MFLVALLGIVGSWGAYFADSSIQTNGARAGGDVLEKTYIRSTEGDSSFLLTYRFTLPSGQSVVSLHGVTKAYWTTLSVGSVLTILYSPTDPQRNFPEGFGVTSLLAPVAITVVFGAVGGLAGALVVLSFWPRAANPRNAA